MLDNPEVLRAETRLVLKRKAVAAFDHRTGTKVNENQPTNSVSRGREILQDCKLVCLPWGIRDRKRERER